MDQERVHPTPSLAGVALPYPTEETLLVNRVRAGEREAFDILFQRHKDEVYRCLWHLLDGDLDVIEEAVGNVFLSAYRGMTKFRGEAAFSTWLYRIAVREAFARRRQRKQSQTILGKLFSWHDNALAAMTRYTTPITPESSSESDRSDPLEAVLHQEQDRLLHEGVRRLPEPYRTPVILRYLNSMDNREIARILNRPDGTIRYQISRGLELLRERLGSGWRD